MYMYMYMYMYVLVLIATFDCTFVRRIATAASSDALDPLSVKLSLLPDMLLL